MLLLGGGKKRGGKQNQAMMLQSDLSRRLSCLCKQASIFRLLRAFSFKLIQDATAVAYSNKPTMHELF